MRHVGAVYHARANFCRRSSSLRFGRLLSRCQKLMLLGLHLTVTFIRAPPAARLDAVLQLGDGRAMPQAPSIPLPRHWSKHVKSGFLHALALARAVLITVRSGYENSPLARARLIVKAEHLAQENAWLREELRIKDARMARILALQAPALPSR